MSSKNMNHVTIYEMIFKYANSRCLVYILNNNYLGGTVVGGGCPPPVSPRCRVHASARSAPASPLVYQTPPGIPLPGTAVGFPLGNSSCMSWAPHSSGGAQRCRRGAAFPCRVIK